MQAPSRPLRDIRAEQGLTASELGAIAGIPPDTIRAIEKRIYFPTPEEAGWILEALMVNGACVEELQSLKQDMGEPRNRKVTGSKSWRPGRTHPWRASRVTVPTPVDSHG